MADLSIENTVNQFEEEQKKKKELEKQRLESFNQTKIDEANKIEAENEMQGWDYLSYGKKEEFGKYLNSKYGNVSRLDWGKLYNIKLMQDSLGMDKYQELYRQGLMTPENIDNIINQRNGAVLNAQFDTLVSQFKNPETGQYEGLDDTTQKMMSLFGVCDNNKKREIIDAFKKAAELDKPRQEAFAKAKQFKALKDELYELQKDPVNNAKAIEEKTAQVKKLEENIENLQEAYGDQNWFEEKAEWLKDWWDDKDHNQSELHRRGYTPGSIKTANLNKEKFIDAALNYNPEETEAIKRRIARYKEVIGKGLSYDPVTKLNYEDMLAKEEKSLQKLEDFKNNQLSNANYTAANNDHIKRANDAITTMLNEEALDFASSTKDQVQQYLEQSEYKALSGDDLNDAFEKAIKEDGNAVYQAYWRTRHNGDYGTDVMKHFSDSDKRGYLASRDVYTQALGTIGANALLSAQAQDYVASHQTDTQKFVLNSKSIVIGLTSNGADIVNGFRLGMLQAMDVHGVKIDVCVDANNNIYNPEDVIQLPGAEGKMFIKNEKGETIEVHQTQMTPTQLDALGYDWSDLQKRRSFFNQQYWMKAENYNTWDSDEMDAIDEAGGISVYNAQYKNGERRSLIWDASTNGIIALTDVALIAASGGLGATARLIAAGGKAAKFARVAKAVGGAEKLLSTGYKGIKIAPIGQTAKVAKMMQFTEKFNPVSKLMKAQSVTSMMYSGQRYSFAGAYQQNLEQLNQKVMNDAQQALDAELSTPEGMNRYNQEINNRYMKALQEQGLDNLMDGSSETGKSDPEADNKRKQLYAEIKQQYDKEIYDKAIYDIKNTQEYANAFSSASGQANNIAMMSSFAAGLENLIVANAVFRKGIYDSVEEMTQQTMSKQAGKGVYTQLEDGSLQFNHKLFNADGSKNRWNRVKDFGKITGMTVGFEFGVGYSQSVFMNAGKGNYTAFDDYLMNHYGEDITADTYTGIGAGQAFLNGIAIGLGDEENLRQGLAGIGSFAVNPFSIGWGAATMLHEGYKIRKADLVKEHAAYEKAVDQRTEQLKKEGKSDVEIEEIIKKESKSKSGVFSTESTLKNKGFHPFRSVQKWLAHSKIPIVNYINAYKTQHSTLEMASHVWRNNILSTYVSDVNAEKMLEAQFNVNYALAQSNGELVRSMMNLAALTDITQAGQSKDESEMAMQLMAMEAIQSIERRIQSGDIDKDVSLGDAMRSQMFKDYLGGLINGANKGWDNLSAEEQQNMVTEYITRKNLGDSKNEEIRQKASEIVQENLNNWSALYTRYKEGNVKIDELEKKHGVEFESIFRKELLKHYTLSDTYDQTIEKVRERLQKKAADNKVALPDLEAEGNKLKLNNFRDYNAGVKERQSIESDIEANEKHSELVNDKLEKLQEEEQQLLKTIHDNSHWYNGKKANAARYDALKKLHKNRVEQGKLNKLASSLEARTNELYKSLENAEEKRRDFRIRDVDQDTVTVDLTENDLKALSLQDLIDLIACDKSDFSEKNRKMVNDYLKGLEDAGVLDDLLFLERTKRRQKWSQDRIAEMESDSMLETVLLKEAEEQNSEAAQVRHIADVIINSLNTRNEEARLEAVQEFQNKGKTAKKELEEWNQAEKRVTELRKKRDENPDTFTEDDQKELARYQKLRHRRSNRKKQDIEERLARYSSPEEETTSRNVNTTGGSIDGRTATITKKTEAKEKMDAEIEKLISEAKLRMGGDDAFTHKIIKHLADLYSQYGPDIIEAALHRARYIYKNGVYDKWCFTTDEAGMLEAIKEKATSHALLLDSLMDVGLRDGDTMATVIIEALGYCTSESSYVDKLTELAQIYTDEARDATSKETRKEALDKAKLIVKALERFQHYRTIKHSTVNPDPMQSPSHKEKLKQAKRKFVNVEDSLKNLSKNINKSKKAFKKAKTDAEKEQVAKQLAQYLTDYNEVWHIFYDNLDSDIKSDKKNPMNNKKFKKDRSETMNTLKELLKKYDFEIQDPDYTEQSIKLSDDGKSGKLPNGTKVKVSEVVESTGDKTVKDRVIWMDKVGLKHKGNVVQEVTVTVEKTIVKSKYEEVQNILDTIDEIQDSPLKEKAPEPAKNEKEVKNDANKNEPEPTTSDTDPLADASNNENTPTIDDINNWIDQYFKLKDQATSDNDVKVAFEEAKTTLQKLKGFGYSVRKHANPGDKYKEEFGGHVIYVDTDNPSEHGIIKEVSKFLIAKNDEILQEPEFVVYRNNAEEQRLEQEKLKREQDILDTLEENQPTPIPEVGDPEGSRAELADQIATELAKQQLETAPDSDNPNGLPSSANKPQITTDEITGDTTTKLQVTDSEGKSTEVTIVKPNDSDSKDLGNNGVKTNDEGEVMLGNTFYKYDSTSLEASQGRKATPRKGNNTGTLDSYNKWQENNKTDIQSIIDIALPEIYAADPNVKIHFMYSNDPLLKDRNGNAHTMLCVEYTGSTKTIYDKYKDTYGGIVRAQDGKEYLIVGVAGYSRGKTGESQWQSLRKSHNENSDYMSWKNSNQGGMFVIPNSYTTITDEGIQSGRLRRSDGNTEPKQRSLQELLDSKDSNPEGIKKEDLVLGYVSQDGQLVIPGVKKGVTITPLRHQGDQLNAGSNFIIVNKAGKRVPIFIPTPKASDIFNLNDGKIKTKIPGLEKSLNDYIYQAIDNEGNWNSTIVKSLQDQLSKIFNLEKGKVEIWLGSDNSRVFEIKSNSNIIFRCNVADLKNSIENLHKALVESGAIVRMPNDFSQSNSWWITSGVVTTDVDCLTTVNKGFGINPVNAEGTPKHVSLSKKIASKKSDSQLSADHATGQYLSIKEQKYRRFTENGKTVWKTEAGDEITNQEDIRNLEISFYRYNNNNPYPALNFKDVETKIPTNEKTDNRKKGEVNQNYEYYILPNCPHADSKKGSLWRLNKTTGEWTQLSMDAYNNYKNSQNSQSNKSTSLSTPNDKSSSRSKPQEENKSKISESTKSKVDSTIEKMTNPEQEFHLYNDPEHPELKDKYYVDKNGKKYCRVTATKEGYDKSMAFTPDPQKDYKTPSTTLGNSVDRFNRDFHKGLIKTKDQIREIEIERFISDKLKSGENADKNNSEKEALAVQLRQDIQENKYPELSEKIETSYNEQCSKFEDLYPAAVRQDWENYLKQIAENDAKEEWTDSDGIKHKMYRAVTDDIHAFGEIEVVDAQGSKYTLPVCGVIDKLMIDDAGNYHLRDFKTRRENKVTDRNKKAWTFQLRMYKDFLEKEYGISIKTCQIEMTYWDGRFEDSKGYPTKPEGSWSMREDNSNGDKIQTLYLDNQKFTAKPVASTERIDLTTDVNAFDTPQGDQRVYHYENFPKEYQELCVLKDSKASNVGSSDIKIDQDFVSAGIPKSIKKNNNYMSMINRMSDTQKTKLLEKLGNNDNLKLFLNSTDGKLKLETIIKNILDC